MRKYFTSKQYRKIETGMSINIIEQTKESTFLTYIATYQNKDALYICLCKKRGLFGDSN